MTALVLASLLVASPDSLDAPCLGGDVVTRADLEAAGATTLHDALRLTPVLDGVTTDGFDLWPTSPAGVPFASEVRVLVDGAPTRRGGGAETLGLEALPLAVAEIERVVVCPGDGIAAAAFGGPTIDVQTSPPARRAYAAGTYGNESGDPGPLRYLDPSLPNVDKWGPDAEGGAVARSNGTTAWLTVRDRDFLPTDPTIFPRTLAATVPSRYPKRFGTVVAVAGEARGLRVRVGARTFEDLGFVPALRRELPLDHASAQATVSGVRQRGPIRLSGHGHVSHVRLGRPAWSALDLDPSWADLRLDGALAAAVEHGRQRLAAGLRAFHTAADAPGFEDAVTVGHAWTQAATATDTWGLGMTVAGSTNGAGVGAGGLAEAWTQHGAIRVRLSASARRTLPDEHPGLDVWAGRGYDVVATAAPARPSDVSRLQGQIQAQRGRLTWTASVEGQRARESIAAFGSPTARVVARGSAVRGHAGVQWHTAAVRLRARLHGQGAVSGTEAFREAWARMPRLGAWADAQIHPDGRLALSARLAVWSGTTWADAPAPDLPAMVLLDLGASKRFWGDHLRVSLGGRNVLDAHEQTHPLGAPLAPRLFVRAEARL